MSLLPLFFTNVLAITVLILQILFRWIESMSKGKKHSIRQAARGVLLAIVSTGLLSGCMTMMLDDSTQGISSTSKKWRSDEIRGLSLAENTNGEKGWVFIGRSFDYLLYKGGDEIINLLNNKNIHREQLSVDEHANFAIDTSKKNFTGLLKINYQAQNEDDKKQILEKGFSCIKNDCQRTYNGLEGTIHKKNVEQDPRKIMKFYHPFTVEFVKYQYSSNQGKWILAPFTVALDVVTAPLQLLAFSIIAPSLGRIGGK